jgi:lysophospholipase L1-like esterase
MIRNWIVQPPGYRPALQGVALIVCLTMANRPLPAQEKEPAAVPDSSHDFFVLRDGLENCRLRFVCHREGRVAFLGGSITEAENGWRAMTSTILQERFPNVKFDFVNAGISSTDSTLGPFRLARDVFDRGPVDLLFVEFAVNDHHNSRSHTERIRGMEGIVRQARERDPAIDIVMLYCVEPDKMADLNAGVTPAEIASHDEVAAHYGVPSIDLAREVTERINAGEFTWEDFGGLHPAEFGHRIYAESIKRLFDAAWRRPVESEGATPVLRSLPEPLDPLNYGHGRFVALDQAVVVNGWRYVESWTATDAGTRPGFREVPMLVATEPGAIVKLYFKGTAVGILVVAGPDVGVLEYSINGGAYQSLDQFTRWSNRLHIPWAYILEADLPHGDHELVLRTTSRKNAESTGHAARIVKFLVN